MLQTLAAAGSPEDAQALQDIQRTRSQAQEELRRLDSDAREREQHRAQLSFDLATLTWPEAAGSAGASADGPAWSDLGLAVPQELPWPAPQEAAVQSLGPGTAPPGLDPAGNDVVLGIDLLASEGVSDQLELSGAGGPAQCTIRITPLADGGVPGPWQILLGLLAATALMAGIASIRIGSRSR